ALTGPFSKEGKLVKDGYDFWLAEVNKRGGIMIGGKRRPVQVVFYDDESNAQTSARLTEKLITEDKVQFLLGPFSSPITMQTSVIGEKYKILTIATQANANVIYERGFKYVVSVLPPATAYMKLTLEMASKLQPKPKTVAIMALNNPFGILAAEGAREHAKAYGFDVVYFEKYPAQASDVSAFLTQIKAKNPDILVASGFFQESLLIVKQSKELKFCPKMIALTVGPDVPDFTKSLGKDADYIYGSAWWLPNMGYKGRDFGSSRDYSKAVTERLGREPNYHVASGTAAGLFLQMAIEKANSLDTDAVRKAFGTMDIETFWGTVAWNEKGQNIKGASGPIQIQNGKLVSVYPESLREAPAAYPMPCWDKR
ncbi:MAG: amino acid ABC transporter substrate-binding protein, partial [Dehalococcoidia bacterium]|nr:amino acid ABC transporter substrate-binding protein [Dehalococcoidia bacterium]